MRRITPLLLALLLALTALGGCTSASAGQGNNSANWELQEGQRELYGKISAARGNEVTLVIGTPVSQGQGSGQGADSAAGSDPGTNAGESTPPEGMETGTNSPPDRDSDGPPSRDGGQRPDGAESAATDLPAASSAAGDGPPAQQQGGQRGERTGGEQGGPGSGGGIPAMGGGSGGMGGMGSVTLDYTGEELTLQIPVTATVQNGQGENARTVRFTQLAVKNVVRIVLDQQDHVVLVQVVG